MKRRRSSEMRWQDRASLIDPGLMAWAERNGLARDGKPLKFVGGKETPTTKRRVQVFCEKCGVIDMSKTAHSVDPSVCQTCGGPALARGARVAYVAVPEPNPVGNMKPKFYVIGVAVEDEPGFEVHDDCIYHSFATAQKRAMGMNRSLGISDLEAYRIVMSTMKTKEPR